VRARTVRVAATYLPGVKRERGRISLARPLVETRPRPRFGKAGGAGSGSSPGYKPTPPMSGVALEEGRLVQDQECGRPDHKPGRDQQPQHQPAAEETRGRGESRIRCAFGPTVAEWLPEGDHLVRGTIALND
jgi:hypothetical protein